MRCPSCFSITPESIHCDYCGYSNNQKREGLFLPLGTSLRGGEYITGKVLGRPGGFGITYLAWDTRLDVKVAVKEYLPFQIAGRAHNNTTVFIHTEEYQPDFDFGLERFLEEAKTLAQFRHSNIVRVLNFFRENGTAYMVMDYLEGQSLAEYLVRVGKLTGPDAVALFSPILEGLSHIHAKNFLHRDIKPANIYLSEEGQAILLDFGAARQAIRERSQSLTAVVTPGFAPWEQYHRKGRQGPWTDVYACAATMYALVTGQTPPDGSERAIDDEITPVAILAPGLDASVSSAIMKGLAVKPDERPQTAAEFLALLSVKPIILEKPSEPKPIPEPAPIKVQRAEVIPKIEVKKPQEKKVQAEKNSNSVWTVIVVLILLAVGWGILTSVGSSDKNDRTTALKIPRGDAYNGASINGLPDGYGTYMWSNGDKYQGNWKAGQRAGQGTMTWKDGREIIGAWASDKPQGTGKLSWGKGVWVEGEWQDGAITSGRIKNADYGGGLKIDYNGTFSRFAFSETQPTIKKNGQGVAYVYKADGNEAFKYTGKFVNDYMDDENAQVDFPNGSKYKGAVKYDKLNGYGVFTWPDGRRWAGNWENDKQK